MRVSTRVNARQSDAEFGQRFSEFISRAPTLVDAVLDVRQRCYDRALFLNAAARQR
jgi:hypothetical protein